MIIPGDGEMLSEVSMFARQFVKNIYQRLKVSRQHVRYQGILHTTLLEQRMRTPLNRVRLSNLNWTCDMIGNRLSEPRDSVTDAYSYLQNAGSGNTAILQQIQLGIGGFKTYTYGPAGHLEEVNAGGNVIDFTSDAAGRLSRLERPAGDARANFRYDGRSFLSHSVGSTIQGLLADDFERGDFGCWDAIFNGPPGAMGGDCTTLTTDPVYSSQGLLHSLEKVDSPGAFVGSNHVVYFAGRPVAWVAEESGAWMVETVTTDHLGTPVVLEDASGSVVWSGGFEPFGWDWSGAGAAGLELRLPGQWSDGSWVEAGLGVDPYYNVHRWFESVSGRYTRSDPFRLSERQFEIRIIAEQPNDFGYALASPLTFTDPLGLLAADPVGCVTRWAALGTTVGATVGAVVGGLMGGASAGTVCTFVAPGVGTVVVVR